MTVSGRFFAEVVLKSVGYEHTWDFRHMFHHLVELVLESPLHFTELRLTLVQGSFRQEYSSMCIFRPEKYRQATRDFSHFCWNHKLLIDITDFWNQILCIRIRKRLFQTIKLFSKLSLRFCGVADSRLPSGFVYSW